MKKIKISMRELSYISISFFSILVISGVILSSTIRFKNTDITDIPVYPGAERTTETAGVNIPKDLKDTYSEPECVWTRYITDDCSDDVIAWYDTIFVENGYDDKQERSSGTLLYSKDTDQFALYVFEKEGVTNIVLVKGEKIIFGNSQEENT